jgi:WD40 repeat protein
LEKLIEKLSLVREDNGSVAFSPDNTLATESGDDETTRLRDARTGEHQLTLTEHTSWVNSVVFRPDGNTITMLNPLSIDSSLSLILSDKSLSTMD